MRYLELSPSPPLDRYIQLLWCLELDEADDEGPPERIAPDAIVELVFHYRDPMEMRFAGESFAKQPRSSAVTQTRRFVEIQPRRASGLLSVRFRPWGAYHFFDCPVSEIADQLVAAEDLWDRREVSELEEQLAIADCTGQRKRLVEEFLLRRLRSHQKADVEGLVREIWRRRGRESIAQLATDFGFSGRSLQRTFSNALGTTPKGFSRLARFLHACSILRSGQWSSLTKVAHDCGYYDQAHCIGEFKELAGLTPGELARNTSFSHLEIG